MAVVPGPGVEPPDEAARAQRLQRLFEAKAHAELADADALLGVPVVAAGSGALLPAVVLVKGAAEAADLEAGRALAGADGEAAGKAMAALGFDARAVYALCSRPEAVQTPAQPAARAARLELAVEALDPRLVIALDPEAAADLAAAFRCGELAIGEPVVVRGRVFGALEGLSASLTDQRVKARVWDQFKRVTEPISPLRSR